MKDQQDASENYYRYDQYPLVLVRFVAECVRCLLLLSDCDTERTLATVFCRANFQLTFFHLDFCCHLDTIRSACSTSHTKTGESSQFFLP